MRLFVKQKVLTLAPQFSIKDEWGNDRYFVQGKVFSPSSRMQIFDSRGQEVALIYRRLFQFLPRFVLEIGGQPVAEIVKEFSFFRPKYRVEGSNLRVDGDFWSHEYSLYEGGYAIMHISKQWFTWGDSYMLDIYDDRCELLALGVVLAIDCVLAAQQQAANSTT